MADLAPTPTTTLPTQPARRGFWFSMIFLCLWIAALAIGVHLLNRYEFAPSATAAPVESWPANSQLKRIPGQATLIMTVHPQCPCSRASIEELSKIMTKCRGSLIAYVIFMHPPGFSEQWVQSDLWTSAARIPGVSVLNDNGAEINAFHAQISGQVFLYDPHGVLLFDGGITPSRGHDGDNAGADAIVSLITGRENKPMKHPVYGCSLK